MALGKTVTYTPFQETSFGYGSNELSTNYATEFPNSDDTVKIIIEHTSGNWDNTGHISTPSSGTAVSMYNGFTNQWICKGERDDVDTVLSQLKFFPADHPESRPYDENNTLGFDLKLYKPNTTSGSYSDDLDGTHLIGDTVFSIKAYDGSDVQQASETLTFDPTEPSYTNQRPYWSVEPSHENYDSSSYDSALGAPLDLGTISHGTDTEQVELKIYFRTYSQYDETNSIRSSTPGSPLRTAAFTTEDTYGEILYDDRLFIGNKIPQELEQGDPAKFSFIGTVQECQLALDNITYKTVDSNQKKTFTMVLTISDGATASLYHKHMWHTQDLNVSTLPNQSFKEDTTTIFDLGYPVFSNLTDLIEVNSYKAVITLDATGTSGATSFGTTTTVDTETYSSGVLTLVDSNLNTLKTAVRNLEFVPVQDFATDFTFTVQFTFENSTLGSSYTHTAQTINVTAQEQAEVENITTTHNWNEDQVYYFKENSPLQIIHPYNENFRVDFNIQSQLDLSSVGDLQTSNTDVTKTVLLNTITFTGTRDQLNDAITNLYFVPASDFDESFTINVTVTRTSGSNLANADVSTGTFTMTATAQEDYSHIQPAKVTWKEDTDFVDFSTGLVILDTSTEDPLLEAYEADYKLTLRAKYNDGTDVSADDMSWGCVNTLGATVTGSGTTADPLIITGSRVQLNTASNSLRMIPSADFTATQDFRFEYRLEKGLYADNFYALYINYNKSVKFDKGTPSDEFEAQADTKFGLERITPITDYQIVDAAVNKQYTITFTLESHAEGYLRAKKFGTATVEYDSDNSRLTLFGFKEDLNKVLQSVEYIPTFGYNTDFKIYYTQTQNTDSIQQHVGTPYWNMVFDSSLLKYSLDNSNDLFYAEDLLNQDNILVYTKLQNLDGAEFITDDPIHYVTTLRLSPTTQIYFTNDFVEDDYFESDVLETRGSSLVFTGSRDTCNEIIKNMSFNAYADQIGDVDIYYTQERYRNDKFDEIQVNDQNALTIRCSGDDGEVIVSPVKQYFTDAAYYSTSDNVSPTQRYLQEFAKKSYNEKSNDYLVPFVRYTPPLQIIDKASSPEGETLYKLEVISSNIPNRIRPYLYIEEIPYVTKQNFHNIVNDGLRIVAKRIDNPDPNTYEDTELAEYVRNMWHNRQFDINIRIKRKLADGTESILQDDKLTYQFVSKPWIIKTTRQDDGSHKPTLVDQFDVVSNSRNMVGVQNGSWNDLVDYNENSFFARRFDEEHWAWVYPGRYNYIDAEKDMSKHGFDWFIRNYGTDRLYVNKKISGQDVTKNRTMRYISIGRFGSNEYSQLSAHFVKPFDLPTAFGVMDQKLTNNYGLTASHRIDFKQRSIKYTEDMNTANLTGTDKPRFAIFGNDSGGQAGGFTIKPDNIVIDNLNVNNTLTSNAVLCSHFWVSQDKYAFKFLDAYDNVYSNWSSSPFIADYIDPLNGNKDFPVDERYIVAPGDGLNMRVSKKSLNRQGKLSEERSYDVATRLNTSFSHRRDYDELGDGQRFLVRPEATVTFGTEVPENNTLYDDKNLGYRYLQVNTYVQRWHKLSDVTHSIYATDQNISSGYITPGLYSYYVRAMDNKIFVARKRVIDEFDAWFGTDVYNFSSNLRNSTFDYYVIEKGRYAYLLILLSYEAIEQKLVEGTTDTYVDEYTIKNGAMLYRLDLNDQSNVFFNWERIGSTSAADNVGSIPNEQPDPEKWWKSLTDDQLHENNVWRNKKEKSRWARRNPKDNTCRIIDYDLGEDHAFILPTGEWLNISCELKNFKDNPIANLKTDLRGKEIDKFLNIDGLLCYVSLNNEIITDEQDFLVKLDNYYIKNRQFDYLYITQDAYNPKQIYGMMSYLPKGDTLSSSAWEVSSRLFNLNLEE